MKVHFELLEISEQSSTSIEYKWPFFCSQTLIKFLVEIPFLTPNSRIIGSDLLIKYLYPIRGFSRRTTNPKHLKLDHIRLFQRKKLCISRNLHNTSVFVTKQFSHKP